jgi:EpsI family protein
MKNTLEELPAISRRIAFAVTALLLTAAAVTPWLTPRLSEMGNSVDLEAAVPRQFGDWRELRSPLVQVSLTNGTETSADQPYDQTLMRVYVNSSGQRVALALAWGRRQRQEVKIHRPDLCYIAQGWSIRSLQTQVFREIAHTSAPVVGKRMLAQSSEGLEAVSYWMRIGTLFSEDAYATRAQIFTEGLKGRIPDGVLVRASSSVLNNADAAAGWKVTEQFLVDLMRNLDSETAAMLVGPDVVRVATR